MRLTVLNVAYPLAPVGPDAVGGAEQVLHRLDEALVKEGHDSLVIACDGSKVSGTLISIPRRTGPFNEQFRYMAWDDCRRSVARALDECPVQVIHLHGVDFLNYLPPAGVPALVTLHLPPEWYPPEVFVLARPNTFLHCVSASQRHRCPPSHLLLPEIVNGVALPASMQRPSARTYALSLGRICPEKGFHIALSAAARAQIPFVLAGQTFPYPAHEEYFRTQIQPRLDSRRRFIGPVGGVRKQRLLASARCLLAPSLVPETSSLVALEALAAGTPVVAFPSGALAELIQPGVTGFLVADEIEMANAIAACKDLSARNCRESVQQRFNLREMLQKYFAVYRFLADGVQGKTQGLGCSTLA